MADSEMDFPAVMTDTLYYAAELQQWGADLKGAQQQAALAEMDIEIENARAAWDWTVAQADQRELVERLDRAIDGLCHFYRWRGRHQEGETACQMVAARLAAIAYGDRLPPVLLPILHMPSGHASKASGPKGLAVRVLAKALIWLGPFSRALGHVELGNQCLQCGLTLLDRPELASQDTRREKALGLWFTGERTHDLDVQETKRLYEQSLALYRALHDRWGMAHLMANLGWVAMNLDAFDEARQRLAESLALGRALGDTSVVADSLLGLGAIALYRGQLEQAERLDREGLATCQQSGDQAAIGMGLYNLGNVLLFCGKVTEAISLLEQSMTIHQNTGDRMGLLRSNVWLGHAKMHLGQYQEARAYGQTALELAQEMDPGFETTLALFVLGGSALGLDDDAHAQQLLQKSVATYQKISRRRAQVWPLALLGYANLRLSRLAQARQRLTQILRTAAKGETYITRTFALPAAALLLTKQGKTVYAVEIYALASRFPLVVHSRWFEDVAGKHIAAAAAATLPPEVIAAAQERGRARDLGATVGKLLAELEEKQGADAL